MVNSLQLERDLRSSAASFPTDVMVSSNKERQIRTFGCDMVYPATALLAV